MAVGEGQARHGGGLQPLLGRLGVGDVHARTSGPSRSPRTGVAPATARSCTGPPGSRARARSRSQFTPRDRRRADDPRGRRAAGARRSSTGCSRRRSRAPAWSTASTTRTRRNGTTCSTSRWPATAASTTRAGARSPGTAPRGCRPRQLPALDDDVWELYDGTTDWTQAHDLAAEAARAARDAAATVADRGGQVQRAADRRPPLRAAQRDHRRPAAADHGHHARCCSPGMKRLSENSVIDIKNRSFSRDRVDRDRRAADRRTA